MVLWTILLSADRNIVAEGGTVCAVPTRALQKNNPDLYCYAAVHRN